MTNTENLKKSLMPIVVFLAVIIVFALIFNWLCGGRFLTMSNMNNIMTNSIIASFAAWGFCFIMALNYMDLSIGAVIMIAVYTSGELGNMLGVVGVVLGGLLIGIAVMTLNFAIFSWTKVPSWVAGLGLALMYEGLISVYQKHKEGLGLNLVMLDEKYGLLGRPPLIYIMFVIGIVLAFMLFNRSSFGLDARSVGSSIVVAKAMGVNITRTLIATGVISGVFVGSAGFLRESYSLLVQVPQSLSSLAIIFTPLAAIFIAQVLSKWINLIIAVPMCALLIYICYNILAIVGVPSGTLSETMLALFIIVFGMIAQRGSKDVVK
jgi:ribose transport system permease protein